MMVWRTVFFFFFWLKRLTLCDIDLTLPRGQLDLARALIATNVPVIVVLIEGRPRVLEDALVGAAGVLDGKLSFLEEGLSMRKRE